MTLLELQRTVAASVMRRLTPDFGMRKRTADGRPMRAHAATFIKPGGGLTSFERLEIYNRQYWFRVLSAFAEDFPGLEAVLGRKRLDAMAVAYLADNPSASYTLRNLGSGLVRWLCENPKWGGKRYDLVLDVARLEWAYIEAFDGEQKPALTGADLSKRSADSHLSLQPYVRLLELSYPADDFIIAVHRAQPEADVASNAHAGTTTPSARRIAPMRRETTYLAVHRFDYSVYYKRLDREAFATLSALRNGASLADALVEGFAHSDLPEQEVPARVQQWFATWAELGWFYRDWPSRNPQ
jgi:hypothetical protein